MDAVYCCGDMATEVFGGGTVTAGDDIRVPAAGGSSCMFPDSVAVCLASLKLAGTALYGGGGLPSRSCKDRCSPQYL